jgi:H+/Cl- antiporter ClcA
MKMSEERRREEAMLVLGVLLGGLFGIIGGLWSAFYVEWLKSWAGLNPDWTPTIIWSSVVLVVLISYLMLWVRKRLK